MDDHKLTKKEQKALRKLERDQQKLERGASNSKMKWMIFGAAAVIFVGFFAFMVYLSKQQRAENAKKAAAMLTQNGTVKGSKDATIVLTEFGDMQCPACAAANPIVHETLKNRSDVKLIFKHFPLLSIHPNAEHAAIAVEAAGKQGKFWEMLNLMYEKQSDWAEEANPQSKFEGYATSLKLDLEKFRADQKNEAIAKKVDAEREEGIAIGVAGTPTFYVNGVLIGNPSSVEELNKMIDEKAKQ